MSPRLRRVSPLTAGLGWALMLSLTPALAQPPARPATPSAGATPALPSAPDLPAEANRPGATGTAAKPSTTPAADKPKPRPTGMIDGQPVKDMTPQPLIPNINRRSGLLQRWTPIDPHLPPDPRRDQWYDTRWGDPPNLRPHPNSYFNGGLYGLKWKDADTVSYAPYFYGTPGQNTMRPESQPRHNIFRLPRNLLHPFRPVGMYYDQGSYVPVYDLDPLVPGPGAWPWPFFQKLTAVGG